MYPPSIQNSILFEVLKQTWSNMKIGQHKFREFGDKINNKGSRLLFFSKGSFFCFNYATCYRYCNTSCAKIGYLAKKNAKVRLDCRLLHTKDNVARRTIFPTYMAKAPDG